MPRLNDRVAIVTAGATGIGEAISKKFAREGARGRRERPWLAGTSRRSLKAS